MGAVVCAEKNEKSCCGKTGASEKDQEHFNVGPYPGEGRFGKDQGLAADQNSEFGSVVPSRNAFI